jgi:hypothetical protein
MVIPRSPADNRCGKICIFDSIFIVLRTQKSSFLIIRTKKGGIFLYLFILIIAGLTGIITRRYASLFPDFIAQYAGDTLWALALYFFIAILLYRQSIAFRSLLTALLSLAVEVLQKYHAPWIDQLRSTLIGGLILGFGFLWSDLLCYLAGITIAIIIELSLIRKI